MTMQRRGVHSLVAVSMLIGFTVAMAGMLFHVLNDYTDIATSNSACMLHNVSLHDTGNNNAYFVASLNNLGHDTITSVYFTVAGTGNADHEFNTGQIELASGQMWDEKTPVPIKISGNTDYLIHALAYTDSGSTVRCFVTYST